MEKYTKAKNIATVEREREREIELLFIKKAIYTLNY